MSTNGKPGIHAGRNFYPSGNRVIALAYYDGPTEGVVRLADGAVYYFALAEEGQEFVFSTLPGDALGELESLLTDLGEPVRPVWVPRWSFPNEETRASVDEAVEGILESAGAPTWFVTNDGRADFSSFTAVSAAVAAV